MSRMGLESLYVVIEECLIGGNHIDFKKAVDAYRNKGGMIPEEICKKIKSLYPETKPSKHKIGKKMLLAIGGNSNQPE